jgi:hypothetical protein
MPALFRVPADPSASIEGAMVMTDGNKQAL